MKYVIYYCSFRQTYSEMKAPDGEWKFVWAIVVAMLTLSCWVYMFMRNNVLIAMLPPTMTREHAQKQVHSSDFICDHIRVV